MSELFYSFKILILPLIIFWLILLLFDTYKKTKKAFPNQRVKIQVGDPYLLTKQKIKYFLHCLWQNFRISLLLNDDEEDEKEDNPKKQTDINQHSNYEGFPKELIYRNFKVIKK